MVAIHENPKDWFEFILDLDLLDRYFNEQENLENDAFGNSLVIQFLYHANMTEQVYANPTNNATAIKAENILNTQTNSLNNQGEFKCKRIKILRILAIKTACLLKWSLPTFEKDIPVAVMSDLLHIFLRYTMDNDDQKLHSQLDIDNLDNYALFALQLLHRWCIRIIVFSKFIKRPNNKSAIVNVPGIVNPLQHMKEANENILKALINNVQESVDFLEKCLDTLTHDICLPTSECFANLSADTGSYDIIWDHTKKYSITVLKCLISFDLGIFYFQQEKYPFAMKHLNNANLMKSSLSSDDPELKSLNGYTIELKSYLLACHSMLDDDGDFTVDCAGDKIKENNSLKKAVEFEKKPEEHIENILDVIQTDNIEQKLSISLRLNIELILKNSEHKALYEKVCEANLAKLAMDSNYYLYLNYNLKSVNNIIETFSQNVKKLPHNKKQSLNAFFQLFYKSTDSSPKEFIDNFDIKAMTFLATNFSEFTFKPLEKPNFQKFELNDLVYKKHLLQTNKSKVILNYIDSNEIVIQSDKYKNKLRYFWTKWEKSLQPLLFLKKKDVQLSNELIDNIFKSNNNPKELQFYFISFAKINELISVKKYDAAYFLLKGLELKGFKNGRFLTDIALYVNVLKCSSELIFKADVNQKVKTNIEKKVQDARDFFSAQRNFENVPPKICNTILSFLLSMSDYEFLRNLNLQEINMSQNANQVQNKKQRIDIPSKNINSGMIELCKNLSKLCIEIVKNDRIASRKTARDIWDYIIVIFTDAVNPSKSNFSINNYQATLMKESQTWLTRESLRIFLLSLKNPLISSLVISLISTIYNIGESMVNNEIFSEYRYLWPSSMANSSSLNINSILDLMNCLLVNYLLRIVPYNSYTIRTCGDICLASTNYFDALKFYLLLFVCETKFFFKRFEKNTDAYFEDYFEKSIKAMVKSCIQMNKHTHAALLSQMSENNQEYLAVFRGLQDRTVLTMDEMDAIYSCLWDVNLLEFFTYISASRGQIDKRNKCLKLCAAKCINSANSNEIFENSTEAKKKQLFQSLIKYYITV